MGNSDHGTTYKHTASRVDFQGKTNRVPRKIARNLFTPSRSLWISYRRVLREI